MIKCNYICTRPAVTPSRLRLDVKQSAMRTEHSDPDERECRLLQDTHDFYMVRFVCCESTRQRTKQRACLDLKIDLHERLRLQTWADLRKMTSR